MLLVVLGQGTIMSVATLAATAHSGLANAQQQNKDINAISRNTEYDNKCHKHDKTNCSIRFLNQENPNHRINIDL